jgi:hypothetical protein
MRMSCGRSDGELTSQGRQIPREYASLHQAPSEAIYYNRLEYSGCFRLPYATGCRFVRLLLTATSAAVADHRGARHQIPVFRGFLSLVQVRKSCHKQVRGVTPFRRGIA